jgi:hypothetical protein
MKIWPIATAAVHERAAQAEPASVRMGVVLHALDKGPGI